MISKNVGDMVGSSAASISRTTAATSDMSAAIAPFEIVVTPTNVGDEKLRSTAEKIANDLEKAGFDVILDDRDERPGVKFKDADLVGIPFRITVGKKVTEGTVEVVLRSTREVRDVTIPAIVEFFQDLLRRTG